MWVTPSSLKVWLRCNTARAWVAPVRIRASVLVAIKGVAPCFAAREGLGVSLIGGGKGRARGPYQFYTGSGATSAGGGNRKGRFASGSR